MASELNPNSAWQAARINTLEPEQMQNGNLARLSTRLRIHVAAGENVDLLSSKHSKSRLRSTAQAQQNALDCLGLLQTAGAALNRINDIVARMRELATQAATGTAGATRRRLLNQRFRALTARIDRIAEVTEFNGLQLLDGSASAGVDFQVGMNGTSDTLTVSIANMRPQQLGATISGAPTLANQALAAITSAQNALTVIDQTAADLLVERSNLAAAQDRLKVTITNLASARENLRDKETVGLRVRLR